MFIDIKVINDDSSS